MAHQVTYKDYFTRCTFGFIAGFLATLVFQQLTWWVCGMRAWRLSMLSRLRPTHLECLKVISHAVGGESGAFFLPCSALSFLQVTVIGQRHFCLEPFCLQR